MSETQTRHQGAGRTGGNRTKARFGPEFYRQIGGKGGRATAEEHGKAFYQRIGHIGGTKSGARVRELIAKARDMEATEGRSKKTANDYTD